MMDLNQKMANTCLNKTKQKNQQDIWKNELELSGLFLKREHDSFNVTNFIISFNWNDLINIVPKS